MEAAANDNAANPEENTGTPDFTSVPRGTVGDGEDTGIADFTSPFRKVEFAACADAVLAGFDMVGGAIVALERGAFAVALAGGTDVGEGADFGRVVCGTAVREFCEPGVLATGIVAEEADDEVLVVETGVAVEEGVVALETGVGSSVDWAGVGAGWGCLSLSVVRLLVLGGFFSPAVFGFNCFPLFAKRRSSSLADDAVGGVLADVRRVEERWAIAVEAERRLLIAKQVQARTQLCFSVAVF
jgi:hypothetical protein